MPTVQQKQANAAVHSAIRKGTLVRPDTCSACGRKPNDIEPPVLAHHDDYSKPLDVRWLCGGCHSKAHKTERAFRFLRPQCCVICRRALATNRVYGHVKVRYGFHGTVGGEMRYIHHCRACADDALARLVKRIRHRARRLTNNRLESVSFFSEPYPLQR